ncbi:MAG: AMP-binding protein [Opitutae bacterium]|nr:AMP-binding protein [Opitutae bacterium]
MSLAASKNPVFFSENRADYYDAFSEAMSQQTPIFLGNPRWTDEQKRAAGVVAEKFFATNPARNNARVLVPTGGSGGKIRFVAHTPATLAASARALQAHLGATALDCFACLPPWHISGLMPFVRAKISGGKFIFCDGGSFHRGEPLPEIRRDNRRATLMNSLVPTQLRRLLARDDGAEWLRQFDFVLLGGAGVPADLLARAQSEKIALGVGYGMTETASLVALAHPPDFAAGTILPHAKIAIGAGGRVLVAAQSLGETLGDDGILLPREEFFATGDEGVIDAGGRLKILGRLDRFINSGGEKIDPRMVEAAIVAAGIAERALVVGEPDAEWGARVVALLAGTLLGGSDEAAEKILREKLSGRLPREMLPKRAIVVAELPFDAKGKLDRAALARILAR